MFGSYDKKSSTIDIYGTLLEVDVVFLIFFYKLLLF